MINKFFDDFREITVYYEFLIDKVKSLEYVGITNEWLIDNYYLLVEHKNNIINEQKAFQKKVRYSLHIQDAIKNIIENNNYNIDFEKLVSELNIYQKENTYYFSYQEIDLIPMLLLFIYTSKLRRVCEVECSKLVEKKVVEETIKQLENKEITLKDFFNDSTKILNSTYYIFEINNQLKELGSKSNQVFKELNEILKKKNIELKDILNEEYESRIQHNILISNIFNNLKIFFEFTNDDLFDKISFTEKELKKDQVYDKMTKESKDLYRNKIIKNAKAQKLDEYNYVKTIINKSHIGYTLFKEKCISLKVNFYILAIFLLTFISCYFLSKYFLPNRVIGFIILLIPISQLFIQIINSLMTDFVKPKPLPKLDYLKGIPKESATMVVIPTIISDTKKVKEMFDTLETYYLVNKSNNLYFTLLGDTKAYHQKIYEKDEEISKYGVNYASELNEKYGKNIFHFVYRKRVYNEKEGCYLGYERKRGALLQFNKLLLGSLSKEEQNSFFNIHTFTNFEPNIKYVITLDTDTKLVLNTALNLVGAMAHPLNKPVLNDTKTKVISGYAMMQPRVSVDIESTNKSLYSQIFASIGGFNSYMEIVPNAYQDSFKEGSFIGKGIYDLKIVDEIMSDAFPDNLILSHDLLEGNYLRCAYVSDIELIDDFPAKFLTDTTRQHRWARGDTQIIGWLFSKVKNHKNVKVKNPINRLGKFKIFDNIVRMFLPVMMLFMIFAALFFSKHPLIWLSFIFILIILPIIFYLRSKLYQKKDNFLTIYYKDLMVGGKSLVLRSLIIFVTIPYYTKLYMDAFFRTLYRLFISKKNLLNWITAEEAEKTTKTDLLSYIKNFSFNILISFVLIVLGFYYFNIYSIIVGLLFLIAPFVLYYVSKPINLIKDDLNSEQKNELKHFAYKTWLFFEDNLTVDYNYLIPDNFQENRENKLDERTSPTNIGFSLTSIVCAYKLDFIDLDRAVFLIEHVIKSIESLDKWHGHLYNWYNIKTKEVLKPNFISTVDSGNFVGSLMVLNQFLIEQNLSILSNRVDRLIKNTNFKKLYTEKEVFSIGYDTNEAKLSIYNYNKFASESRLTSFVAIAKRDVPTTHWFCLDKSLTSFNHSKGLISWSGTSFEYYMPLLYMKNYSHTLLDETYHFAFKCQKEYIQSIDKDLPWGISESAYDELDNSLNYKYKTFATPYLKAKEEKNNRIVLSPYSSLMALNLFPLDIYKNIKKFIKLDMYGKYGFYESYDLETNNQVKAYFSHHQGMCLIGITNYLKNNLIQNYFHSDISVKTYDILLKEKVQIRANIDMKIAKYKKYDYDKEIIENDIRYFNYISDMPEVSVLSNKKYCLLMNDRGNSFSRYRTIQLNRYRKVTEQDYGLFMYIKDLTNNKVWSNTYAPMNNEPDKYEVIFASDMIKYIRTDNDITTTTQICVTKDHHAELRKITFTNHSEEEKVLELTTYTEPIISLNTADISHRVFNNMFLESSFDDKTNSLITKRKKKEENETNMYMINRLVMDNPLSEFQYETDRAYFLGRNHNASNPAALNKKLNNHAGTTLEPIMSLRNKIRVKPNDSVSVCLVSGFGRSKEQILDIVNTYNNKLSIEKAFDVASLMNIMNTRNMNITGSDMRVYNIMLNYLYQTTKVAVNKERTELLKKNALAQNGLWKFGISGDYPIILIDINDIGDLSFVKEMLKCFEYYKNNSIFIDLVIINSENEKYAKIIKKEIDDEIYHIYAINNFSHTPGRIIVLNNNEINEQERSLLNIVPRLKFILNNHQSLEEKINELQKNNTINNHITASIQETLEVKNTLKLDYQTSYGGFDKNEYVIINKDTPTPWSNVIANENMGTIITNNGCGFTYAYNSGEFKITSWTNDMVVNDKSEGIKINNQIFDPSVCRHGFGYSVLQSQTEDLHQELTEFIALKDNVKLYILKITNKLNKRQDVKASFWINPNFGTFEEKTSRHILTEYMKEDNYLKMRNVYNINFSNITVFMSSSEKIMKAIENKVLVKQIDTIIHLDENEEKTIVFTLGCSNDEVYNLELIKKYNDVPTALKELEEVKEYWKKTLGTITVETPDKSFDLMVNGWYLYQAIASRLIAKTGFYQVSGAFGFRDQLQDSMNIVYIKPELTRKQILINASHQFKEGDCLHWWHEINRFGLRSRYKDDFLWLVYATWNYIEATLDTSILEEPVPYVLGDVLKEEEHEKGMTFTYSLETDTLLKHCELSLQLAMDNLGSHGLPLMGGGDWNDGMNKVGIKGKGESVWLGFFLYNTIDNFVKYLPNKDKYMEFNKKLYDNLNKYAWDGKYYLRAFFDNRNPLGSHKNDECKIDLISQSFAIISEVAPLDRIDLLLEEVSKHLVDKDLKIVKLLDPPFEKTIDNPGYIMNYPKGIRENGGQYTHAVAWYIMALIKVGKYDEAYKIFSMINPINRSLTDEEVNKYKVEPYVIAADIYSSKTYPARGGWTWYTGSAGWFYKVAIKEILGFNLCGDTLFINPHVNFKNYKIKYHYLDTIYEITVNSNHSKKIKLVNDKKVHKIEI